MLSLPPIYAITDRAAGGGLAHPELARRMMVAGIRCLQVREKALPDRVFLPELEACAALGRSHGSIVFVNDRTDLARVAGVGVHLGEEDLPAETARPLLPPGALIGVSTHSPEAAATAFSSDASDYVAFGPVFSSGTKPGPAGLGLEALARAAARRTRPLVAIGGITAENVGSVLDAGADSAAMIGALHAGGRIEENVRAALDAARRRTRAGRIYLVGFMGSGKTTVGRRVAERLGIPFIDLDAEIERTSGLTVRALFESLGEDVFRQRESVFLEATEGLPDAVIATGGGCWVSEPNRKRIGALGTSVFLDASLPILLSRLEGKRDRPLFQSAEQAATLWAERAPFYRMASVCVPVTEESIETAADRVLLALDARARPLRP